MSEYEGEAMNRQETVNVTTGADNVRKDDTRIRKEDRKHKKQFVAIVLGSGLFGGICGFTVSRFYALAEDGKELYEAFRQLQLDASAFTRGAMFFVAGALLLLGLIYYRQAAKGYASWDGEAEDQIGLVEKQLDMGITLTNMIYVVLMVCFGIGSYQMAKSANGNLALLLLYCAAFLVFIFLNLFLQKACVNLEKKINPEKKGSVYDLKFRKKWLGSCDEAEKRAIYEASYHSFTAVHLLCTVLFTALIMFGMLFEIGLLPYILVGAIWFTDVMVYCVYTLRNGSVTAN